MRMDEEEIIKLNEQLVMVFGVTIESYDAMLKKVQEDLREMVGLRERSESELEYIFYSCLIHYLFLLQRQVMRCKEVFLLNIDKNNETQKMEEYYGYNE